MLGPSSDGISNIKGELNMGMTMENKEKCAGIYEIYTGGIENDPSKWIC
jgi:hypothetical protein